MHGNNSQRGDNYWRGMPCYGQSLYDVVTYGQRNFAVVYNPQYPEAWVESDWVMAIEE